MHVLEKVNCLSLEDMKVAVSNYCLLSARKALTHIIFHIELMPFWLCPLMGYVHMYM